jgi:predicted nucleotidyltransferase component of viral defense system
MNKLYYSTVSPVLRTLLEQLMREKLFASFRLVGGTALSLHIGHRMSVDIDLFTAQPYGTVDFEAIEVFFRSEFGYVETSTLKGVGFGKMYMLGKDEFSSVKVDIMYTDEFIRQPLIVDGIRLASVEDIIAMKLEILTHAGRKKDFWDLHALADQYTLDEMIAFHKERYPYSHAAEEIITGFTNFTKADAEFDPDCLQGKHWALVRADLVQFAKTGK